MTIVTQNETRNKPRLTEQIHQEYVLPVSARLGTEELAVLQRTEGERQFIAWHGITAVNRFWLWDIFWEQGQVVLAGLPGHGAIPPPSAAHYARWSMDHFIDVGEALVEQLSNGRPLTLMGHSTGGMIALGVALRRPELVERLILVSPVIWNDFRGIVGFWTRFLPQFHMMRSVIACSLRPGQQSYPVFRTSLRALITDAQSFYSDPIVHQVLQHGYPHYQQTSIDAIAHTARVIASADMRPLILQNPINVPTLLVHGEQDHIVPLEQSEWVARALPNAHLLVLSGAGHTSFGEQQQRFNRRVAAWANQP